MRKILFIIPFFLWTCGGGESSPTEPISILPPTVDFEAEITEYTVPAGNSSKQIKFTNLSKVGISNATPSNTLSVLWKVVEQPGSFNAPDRIYEFWDGDIGFEPDIYPGVFDIQLIVTTEGGFDIETKIGYITISHENQ